MAWPASVGSGLAFSSHKAGRSGPWEYNGNLYGVFQDSTNSHIEVWKSTDGGQTWAEVDSANHKSFSSGSFDSSQVGSTLHITFLAASDANVAYATFNLSTDAWSSSTTGIATPSTESVLGSIVGLGVVATTDGDVFIFYSGTYSNMGSKNAVFYVKKPSGSSFGSSVQFSSALANNYGFRGVVEGLSNVVHVVMQSNTLAGFVEKHLTSGDSLSSDSATTSNSVNAAGEYNCGPLSKVVRSGSTHVNTVYTSTVAGGNNTGIVQYTSVDSTSAATVADDGLSSTADMERTKVGGSAADGTITYVFWPWSTNIQRTRDPLGNGSFEASSTWKSSLTSPTKTDVQTITIYGGDVGIFYDDNSVLKFDGYPALSAPGGGTRTVGQTAHIKVTLTRTAAQTGHILVTNTRTAGQTAHIAFTNTRTASQTAHIQDIRTRTAAQTASLSVAGNTRTSGQSAHIQDTSTRTVAQTAHILTELTRTASQTAHILTELARTASQSAHIQDTLTRTVGQTADISTGATLTRTAGQTAHILTELARTAGQSASLATPDLTRTVDQDASIATSDLTRTATQTAHILVTLTRTAGQSAHILTELTRTVTQTGSIATPDVARTIGQTADISVTGVGQRTVGQSAHILVTSTRTVGQTASILTELARTTAQTVSLSTPDLTRTVDQDAHIATLGLTRTAGQSAHLLTELARTIAQSASVSTPDLTRTIGQTADITVGATLTRTAGQSAHVLVVNVRTTGQTAHVSQAAITRTVGQTAHISIAGTETITIPQMAVIAYDIEPDPDAWIAPRRIEVITSPRRLGISTPGRIEALAAPQPIGVMFAPRHATMTAGE